MEKEGTIMDADKDEGATVRTKQRPFEVKPKQSAEAKDLDLQRKDKVKALELALSQIERQFGEGTIMKLGDQAKGHVAGLSTCSLALDIAFRLWPRLMTTYGGF